MAIEYCDKGSDDRLSEYLASFVLIFYSVVLGSSLVIFSESLLSPTLNEPKFWGLLAVYFTAITSAIGWRQTLKFRYTVSKRGISRVFVDALIGATYLALLFFANGDPDTVPVDSTGNLSSLPKYLWGFVLVFSLWWFSGILRIWEHNERRASRLDWIFCHLIVMAVAPVAYHILSERSDSIHTVAIWILVIWPFPVMIIFRSRAWLKLPR